MREKSELEKIADLGYSDAGALGAKLRLQSRVMFGHDIFGKEDHTNVRNVPWAKCNTEVKFTRVLMVIGVVAMVLWCLFGKHHAFGMP